MSTPAQAEAQRKQLTSDLRRLMEQAEFRRFAYWAVFQLYPADGQSFVGESTHATAFNEGRRRMAIDLGTEMRRANFDAFQRMEREAESARIATEAARVAHGGHENPDSSDL